jgi:putative tryptophan/tyrosine transport system substrate-binding protein
MKRRTFIAGLGGATAWPFAGPLAAEAQHRVGALINSTDPQYQSILAAFREGLVTFGWAEGRNLRIDYRLSGGEPSSLAAYAEELVNLRPDVILAYTNPVARAVQQRTSVIPIVHVAGGGLVRNIARPEGNMTGFASLFGSQGGLWLELFKEAVPRLTRVAHIFSASNLNNEGATIPAALGVTIIRTPVRNVIEIEPAISAFAAEPNGGLLMTGAGPRAHIETIDRLALHYRLPLMRGGGTSLEEGVLMHQGPDLPDLARRASSYVDRILRGAKPSELPVQYPTKFELIVNLKTAKAIGVTIPEAFLARADEVIE